MPSIEARYGADGEIKHYRLIVSGGLDWKGRQIKKCSTWTPPLNSDMSKKQMEREAMAAAYKFEESLKAGFVLDNTRTFAQYAEYVLQTKKDAGLAPTTYERYVSMLERVNNAIGHIKLCDLRPQHLNEFYRDLAENGVRIDCVRAVPKKVIKKKVEATGAAKHIVAEQAGISHTTLNAILRGDPVKMESAKGLATALGYTVSELFTIKDKNIPLSSKTIHEHHRLISVILAMAEREMLIPYNPAAKAIPPKVTKSEPIYYQPEELEDIISALDKAPLQQKTMTYILLDIGCRRGELMGLKWENVDLEKGIIMIKQALLYTKEKGVYVGPPKNGKPRAVYISPETLELLKTHKHEQLKTKIRHMNIWQDSGFVFTKNDGSPMHPDTITRWLNNFSKENNLPHLHPHAFRHTVASLLISNGIDLVTTAAELGHSNATTTAMIYAHQVARSRAEAAGVRAGVFATLRQA